MISSSDEKFQQKNHLVEIIPNVCNSNELLVQFCETVKFIQNIREIRGWLTLSELTIVRTMSEEERNFSQKQRGFSAQKDISLGVSLAKIFSLEFRLVSELDERHPLPYPFDVILWEGRQQTVEIAREKDELLR